MMLNRTQTVLAAAVLGFAAAWVGQAKPGAAQSVAQVKVPQLDVISVKPNNSGSRGMSFGFSSDGVVATNAPAHVLLAQAYHLFDDQIVNEPAWTRTDHFDVTGKVAAEDAAAVPKLTQDQKRELFQQVLKERFGLVAHRETRELPEYALVAAKGGVKLKESTGDDKPDAKAPTGPPGPGERMRGQGARMSMESGRMKFEANKAGFDFLLQILANETGRTVVDKTGLTGKYDYTLTWTPAMGPGASMGGPAGDAALPSADAGPDLFTAIQEQLGLKLEPTKGPVDVLVIDHLERPAEN